MMTTTKPVTKSIFSIICASVFAVYMSVYNGWGFAAYFMLYALLPGYAIADTVLCRTDFDNSFLKLAVSVFLGIFMLFGIYFLLYSTPGIQSSAIKISGPAVTALYAVLCVFKKRTNIINDTKNIISSPLFCTVCVFMLAMMCVKIVFAYPAKASLDYQDYVWHISLVNSLATGHPFRYFNVQAGSLSYHYFSDLFLAIGKMIFGFDGFRLIIQLQPVFLAFINALAAVGFFSYVFRGEKAKTAFACAAVFACYGMGSGIFGLNLVNYFYSQFYSNVNAVTFSIPLMMVALWAVLKALTADKTDIFTLGIITVLMFMLTGAKGPFGIVVTAAFAFAVAVKILAEKKLRLSALLYLAGGSAGFYIAFTTFMNSASDGLEISPAKAFNVVGLSNLGKAVIRLVDKGVPDLAAKIALTPVHFMLVTTVFGVLFILGFFRFILAKNKSSAHITRYLFLLALTVISCGGYYILFHKSTSQAYFLYAALPAFTILATDCLFDILRDKKYRNTVAAVIVAVMALPMVYYQYNVVTEDYHGPKRAQITDDYTDTFSWIEQNTPADCIIATNRHNMPDGTQRWFYDAAYCNRQFYLSGYGYGENASLGNAELDPAIEINRLIFTDYDHKHTLLSNLGIQYLLIYKEEAENVIPQGDGFAVVFETETTCVVEVLAAP